MHSLKNCFAVSMTNESHTCKQIALRLHSVINDYSTSAVSTQQ